MLSFAIVASLRSAWLTEGYGEGRQPLHESMYMGLQGTGTVHDARRKREGQLHAADESESIFRCLLATQADYEDAINTALAATDDLDVPPAIAHLISEFTTQGNPNH